MRNTLIETILFLSQESFKKKKKRSGNPQKVEIFVIALGIKLKINFNKAIPQISIFMFFFLTHEGRVRLKSIAVSSRFGICFLVRIESYKKKKKAKLNMHKSKIPLTC